MQTHVLKPTTESRFMIALLACSLALADLGPAARATSRTRTFSAFHIVKDELKDEQGCGMERCLDCTRLPRLHESRLRRLAASTEICCTRDINIIYITLHVTSHLLQNPRLPPRRSKPRKQPKA